MSQVGEGPLMEPWLGERLSWNLVVKRTVWDPVLADT